MLQGIRKLRNREVICKPGFDGEYGKKSVCFEEKAVFEKNIDECGIRNGEMIENKRIKIGIISDTHGLLRTEVLDILQSCDCIFHAGDVDRPELLDTIRSLGALYVVRGNNDGYWAQNLRRSLNFTVGNVKFFMVHDRKDVAWELGDTQVVIF